MRNFSRLLSPEAADGNGSPNTDAAPESKPTVPAPNAPAPAAASIVAAGKKVESDVATEMELKKVQSRNAQLEDEMRALKQSQSAAPAAAAVTAAVEKKSWLNGGSFFE